MLPSPFLISPSADFWSEAAIALLQAYPQELHTLRIVVPTFLHGQQLKTALGKQANGALIAPRIHTLSAWIESQNLQGLQNSQSIQATQSGSDLMTLYAELRQHGWLKKLFSAERNTDLMPLAQTLLSLSDELTQAWLPDLALAEQRWQAALVQLEQLMPGRDYLSNEAQLVWAIWKSRLDGSDASVMRWQQMMDLAQQAQDPLVWIHPVSPDPMERAFLQAYSQRQPVYQITLDWRAASLMPLYAQAWPELMSQSTNEPITTSSNLSLYPASNLEQEAQHGAQTVLDWLQDGKSNIAIVAQDRLVARRISALLARAQVLVKDETGWKLSTTRAAASLAAWLDVIATQANVVLLLDWLKSPFSGLLADTKHAQVMAIEMALHQANVTNGWSDIDAALRKLPAEQALLQQIASQAHLFKGRKSMLDWSALTRQTLQAFGMETALASDAAGAQVLALLAVIEQDKQDGQDGLADRSIELFSFSEWRAFLRLQLEAAPFATTSLDQRVVMLPLNGARLRVFDAILMVGCDATHLPSQASETLFFGNTVRRELGLPTREIRQQQQLRDFAALLHSPAAIVLSWQAYQNGQPQAASAWIERLQLTLECAAAPELPIHTCSTNWHDLLPKIPTRPAPSAAQLLPAKLSASGYNSLVACPYQFFATRMLGLSTLAELSEMPEKRDYGDWLHEILKLYHTSIPTEVANREQALRQISEQVFAPELAKNPAVLAYYTRWQKVIPAYLDWANTWEEQGWHFVSAEQWHERRLQWAEGEILLHGRIDRIDANDAGEQCVLDYKTRAQPLLKSKLATGEDHQLPFYGVLLQQADSAHYVALELNRDKTGTAAAPDYANWQRLLETSLVTNLRAIQAGTALPANGIDSVCEYCEMRGVCRKGAW